MAYALVAHTFFKGAPDGGTTPPVDTTGANLIVLNTTPNHIGGPTTPFDSFGNIYTLVQSQDDLQALSQLWYCYNPIVGPLHTFSSVSATTNFMGISAAAFSGSTANPFNQATGQNGRPPNPPTAGSIQPGPLTPGANNCLVVVGFAGEIHTGTQVINSGFSITDSYNSQGFVNLSGGLAYLIQTTATTVNPTLSVTGWVSGGLAITMATFFSAAAPPPPTTPNWSDFEIWAMRAIVAPKLPISVGMFSASAHGSAIAIADPEITSNVSVPSITASGIMSALAVTTGNISASVSLAGIAAGTAASLVTGTQSSASVFLVSVSSGGSVLSPTVAITGGSVSTSVALVSVSAGGSASATTTANSAENVSLVAATANGSVLATSVSITGGSVSASVPLVSVASSGQAAAIVGPSNFIASIQLENTSSSSTSIHVNANMLGHPYKQGNLPDNPIFKLSDGTICPYSKGQRATWPADGTVMQEAYRLQIPKAIAPGISDTISIYSGGTAPAASTLSLTDITSNTDFNVVGTLLQSPGTDTGTWTAYLNDAITNGSIGTTIEIYDNGQAGIHYIIDGDFKQGGLPHRQLKLRWMVQVLPTAGQTLSGFRVLGLLWQPNYDVDTPTKGLRIFSALTFQNGATVIRDMANTFPASNNPTHNAFPFTWVSGSDFQISTGTTPLYGCTNGYVCRLTTTGTLPGGLSTGQTYGIEHSSTDAKFKLQTNIRTLLQGGGTPIVGTSAGTGTHTMTILPFVAQFYGIYTSSEAAKFDDFDASGNLIAETPLRFRMDPTYWVSTKTFLPYKIPASSASNKTGFNATTYIPNGAGGRAATAAIGTGNGMDQGVGSTGDIPDLGPIPLQYTYHLFNQTAVDEAVVRTNGMCNSHWAFRVRSSANGRIVAANNGPNQAGGTYAGMDGPFPQFRWLSASAANLNGHSIPSGANGYDGPTFAANDTSHMPNWASYPYQFTGEPQFRDQMIDNCSNAIAQRSKGDPTIFGNWTPVGMLNNSNPSQANQFVSGSPYYGTLWPSPGGTRDDAWAVNLAAHMMLIGDSLIEKAYARDLLKSTGNFIQAWTALTNTYQPFAISKGILHFMMQTSQQPGFQWGYRYFTSELAYLLTGDSNWLAIVNAITKYYEFAHTNGGAYNEGQYVFATRLGGNDASDYAVQITGITKANPGVVSFASAPSNFANGDMVMLAQVGGMTQADGQIYRMANVTSTSFALHDIDDNPVDTSGFSTYTSGGFAGAPLLPDVNRWAGQQNVLVTWTTTSPAFTAHRGNGDGAAWVWTSPPVMTNGDWIDWANQVNDTPLPPGLLKFKQYFIINADGSGHFDVTTVDGDAGHIVLPTSAQTAQKNIQLHRKTPPTNEVNYGSNAGTFQLSYGPVNAAKAIGATVTQQHLDDLETIYQATVSTGRSNPSINSKYLMNPSYP